MDGKIYSIKASKCYCFIKLAFEWILFVIFQFTISLISSLLLITYFFLLALGLFYSFYYFWSAAQIVNLWIFSIYGEIYSTKDLYFPPFHHQFTPFYFLFPLCNINCPFPSQFPIPHDQFNLHQFSSFRHQYLFFQYQFPLPIITFLSLTSVSIPLSNINSSFFLPDRDSVLGSSIFLSHIHALKGAWYCPQPQTICSGTRVLFHFWIQGHSTPVLITLLLKFPVRYCFSYVNFHSPVVWAWEDPKWTASDLPFSTHSPLWNFGPRVPFPPPSLSHSTILHSGRTGFTSFLW